MKTVLVTGGGGFLGKAVVRRLLESGWNVRSFSRRRYPDLEENGVDCRRGDLADLEAVCDAAEGCEVIFHVGAKAGVWGRYSEYYEANCVGTQNVLTACGRYGIGRLIYTSSPSVVHAGDAIEGGDESLPYPDHFESPYPETKAMAEQMVLAANGDHLSTVALRPHLIWGPNDNHLVPKIVARARTGKLKLVGDGSNLVDTVYIDNAANAHLNALETLRPGAACSGKAYFITNGEPRPIKEIINRMVGAAGLPPVEKSVPMGVAVAAGRGLELVHRLFAPGKEPMMTAFLARQFGTAHWFDISAARRDLGYEPRISLEEGFRRLEEWFAGQKS
ncbi:MAG: NAD-dependent epimerase/dehydratase family protein [Thermoanaerobaculales bacterium]|nr:NAD-dependent epimerase/dehydratase family protein [Thermoanaerobaculales bacterium]